MPRHVFILLVMMFVAMAADGTVVADYATRLPLRDASVFDRDGHAVGTTGRGGHIPDISETEYPLTIRYMGYAERSLPSADYDTIFLHEIVTELPEMVVESRRHTMLHILAYVREYSTLTTYTDTVFMFREKMVDYMLPGTGDSKRFKGWTRPRILTSKSYYRYTDSQGRDSVSDRCNHHFSWADWVGILPAVESPARLRSTGARTDTVRGKYSPTEIWSRQGDRLNVDVNVLADTSSRKWVPNLSRFFSNDTDFEKFRLRLNYDDIDGKEVTPLNLTGYSFNIESNGRGRVMFMFNRVDQPFYVSTYAEVYIADKEFITIKEARKWQNHRTGSDSMAIYEPASAPALSPNVLELIARVNNVDADGIRLAMKPDHRLMGRGVVHLNAGQQILQRIKGMFGIDQIIGRRKWNRHWNDFSRDRVRHNNASAED